MKKYVVMYGIVLSTAIAHADVSIINAVGPVEGWWNGGSNSSNKTMDASATITDGSGTYSGFTPVASVVGTIPGRIVHGSIATGNPTVASDALTDDRLDTGLMNPSDNIQYWLGETVSSSHTIALVWNAYTGASDFYDQHESITAYDSGGTPVGSTVNLISARFNEFGTANLAGFQTLNNRGMYGLTVDVSDFGGTAGDIAYVSMAAAVGQQNETDMMFVGTALVPEPATTALVMLFGGAVLFVRRNLK